MAMSYDRRAPEELMAALRDGFAASLKDYVLAHQYPVDLQLRGYEGKNQNRATLYVGLTKVLELHHRPNNRFKLSAHPTWSQVKHGWQGSWEKLHPASSWASRWDEVDDYLDSVIPTVGNRFLKEGRTQTAVNTLQNESLTVIDREVTIAFGSTPEKKATLSSLAAPLLEAVDSHPGPSWWKTRPSSLGDKCDALAVRDGELLAIEIKPTKAPAITWVPLQVRHYANVVDAWAKSTKNAASVIEEMVEQRASLGLCPKSDGTRLKRPLVVRPMVVLQHGTSHTLLQRLSYVRHVLIEAGIDDPPLEVMTLTAAGRLKPIPLI